MFRAVVCLAAFVSVTGVARAEYESFFEERIKDFGAVKRGPALIHYYRFTNRSNQTLNISNVRVSCGCVTASAPIAQIKPGESSYIQAHMDTTRFIGSKTVTIYVQFTQPRFEEVSLSISAFGRDDFTLTPDTLAYGQVRHGSTPESSVQIRLYGDPNCQITTVTADSAFVQPKATLVSRSPTDVTYQIAASLRSDLPVGKWYTDVWLQTSKPGMTKMRIPLSVDVIASLTASPTLVEFPETKLKESNEQNVIVRGEKPFKIKEVKGAEGALSVDGVSSDEKAVHVLKVKFAPTQAGELVKNITIIAEGGEAVSVAVKGKGE